jgi:hypothetical protein
MNLFIGIGKIVDAYENGRVLKFTLSVQQEKPCNVPCLIFDPDSEVKRYISQAQTKHNVVWLQGRLSSYEFESRGKSVRKIEVITYPKSIKLI